MYIIKQFITDGNIFYDFINKLGRFFPGIDSANSSMSILVCLIGMTFINPRIKGTSHLIDFSNNFEFRIIKKLFSYFDFYNYSFTGKIRPTYLRLYLSERIDLKIAIIT